MGINRSAMRRMTSTPARGPCPAWFTAESIRLPYIRVFGPRYEVHRLAAILNVPMSQFRWIDPRHVDLAGGYPAVGSLLYFDGVLAPSTLTPQTAALRPSTPTVVGNVRIVPLYVDEARRIWVERIESAR